MHKIILSTLLLTSLSFADKSYSFFGAQTSFVNYNNIASPALGLKYGVQKNMWRTTVNLDYATTGSDTLSSLSLQVDKGVLRNVTQNSPLKPYVGASLGLLQYQGDKTDKGYGYGLNTGLTYLLNDAMDIDLDFKYIYATKMDAFNSINTLTLSLHYFY